jgi:hypothetical protein
MALSVTAISPDEVCGAGGTRLLITGDFTDYIGQPFVVKLTPDGGGDTVLCLSGVSGSATTLYPRNVTDLYCYLPELPHDTYDVTVELLDESEDADLLAALLVERRQYFSKVFDIRAVWPPNFRVGPRTMELLEPVT